MINTKDKNMTPAERKAKVAELREEHQPYFNKIKSGKMLYIYQRWHTGQQVKMNYMYHFFLVN